MPAISQDRYLVQAGWDDVPHLPQAMQAALLRSIQPHLREARTKGIPSMGAGAIYTVPLDEVLVRPFEIPAWWPRFYGMDVGWKRTAAIWLAWDRANDTLYAYAEHYGGQSLPVVHAGAIQARGKWIKGVIDPAARGRSQFDGEQLLEAYKALGLHLKVADNAVEAGIYEVWSRLMMGRLKFFTTLGNLSAEYRLYRRDDKGKVVKAFDHLLDALRYAVLSGLAVASVQAPARAPRGGSTISDQTAGY